jgi:branched-chain amino acid transport system permease protein
MRTRRSGIDDTPLEILGLQVSEFDTFASTIAIAIVMVAVLFSKARMGISLRAVADDTRSRTAWARPRQSHL